MEYLGCGESFMGLRGPRVYWCVCNPWREGELDQVHGN